MIESNPQLKSEFSGEKAAIKGLETENLSSMCKSFNQTINQLYNPIDAVNRFINLALQSLESNSQGRQFLVESKQGIRRTSLLLKQLDHNCKEMEKEILRMGSQQHEREEPRA